MSAQIAGEMSACEESGAAEDRETMVVWDLSRL